MSDLVRLEAVSKTVGEAASRNTILRSVNFQMRAGEFVAIMGASGSGKSTLLNILGLLDTPSQGRVLFNEQEVSSFSEDAQADLRARSIGFIFQAFHLLPYLTALGNVLLPMHYRPRPDATARATLLLNQMNLGHRLQAYPSTLSGGERQRVAIARALTNEPHLLLADEPTGALDSRSGHQILEGLTDLNRRGVAIVLVTHDPQVARRAQRVLEMKDGAFV